MNLKVAPPLRIAILECDTPLPKTQKKFQSYGGVFEFLLQSGAKALASPDLDPGAGFEFSRWQIQLNPERYPDPESIDAILITGSSKSLCWTAGVWGGGLKRGWEYNPHSLIELQD